MLLYSSFIRGENAPKGAGIVPALKAGVAGAVRVRILQGAQTVPHLKRHPGGIGNGIHHISAAETGRTVHSEAVIPAEADGILIGTGAETGITDALLQYRTVLSAESVVLSNQPTL